MISFVSILIVPIVTLTILARRKIVPFEAKMEMLGRYAVSVCANVIVTRLVLYALRLLFGIHIYPDSQLYVAVATVVAVITAFAYEAIVKYLHASIKIGATESDEEEVEK